MKKDFLKDIKEIGPDIICLQETKASEIDLKAIEYGRYHIYKFLQKKRKDILEQLFCQKRNH